MKASVFDVLGSRYGLPGELPPLSVLDLFCGTGSMGLEALSRGAARCTFLDSDRSAIRLLRSNIRALDAGDRSTVVVADAWTCDLLPHGVPPYALVFIDPPYADSRNTGPSGIIAALLSRLVQPGLCTPHVLVLCRNEAAFPLPAEVPLCRQVDRRVYGCMAVSLYQPVRHLDEAGSPA